MTAAPRRPVTGASSGPFPVYRGRWSLMLPRWQAGRAIGGGLGDGIAAVGGVRGCGAGTGRTGPGADRALRLRSGRHHPRRRDPADQPGRGAPGRRRPDAGHDPGHAEGPRRAARFPDRAAITGQDRKSTRLNSSHVEISYAVFCLKKKKKKYKTIIKKKEQEQLTK